MQKNVAQIVLSKAIYSIDKPYDYEIPDELVSLAQKGRRVLVPFGRGNKEAYGVILSVSTKEVERSVLKKILHIYEDFSLTNQQMTMANWMRQRYFCTFFDAQIGRAHV